jgi:transcriptional regulator with XRE-family HTH domain
MNTQQFKIWLVTNGYNQKSLAEKLNISPVTITNYVKADRFPSTFVYALHGLALINLTVAQYDAIAPLLTESQRERVNIIEE